MRLFTFLFFIYSFNATAQNADSDTLNQGECWNIEYQYLNDFGLKKRRLEIQYLNETEFILTSKCLAADSFTVLNSALLFGRRDNPNDTTLTSVELNLLDSNNITLDELLPMQEKVYKLLVDQPNLYIHLQYSIESTTEKSYPMNLYYELQVGLKELLEKSSKSGGTGIFSSSFCTLGCEGCFELNEVEFNGLFQLSENLNLIRCP